MKVVSNRCIAIAIGAACLSIGFQNCSKVKFTNNQQTDLSKVVAMDTLITPEPLPVELAVPPVSDVPPIEVVTLPVSEQSDYRKICNELKADQELVDLAIYNSVMKGSYAVSQHHMLYRARGNFNILGQRTAAKKAKVSVMQDVSGDVLVCDTDFDDIISFNGRLILVNSTVGRILYSHGKIIQVESQVKVSVDVDSALAKPETSLKKLFADNDSLTDDQLQKKFSDVCAKKKAELNNSVSYTGTLLNVTGQENYKFDLVYEITFLTGELSLVGNKSTSQAYAVQRVEGNLLVCNGDILNLDNVTGEVVIFNGSITNRLVNNNGKVRVIQGKIQSEFGTQGRTQLIGQ